MSHFSTIKVAFRDGEVLKKALEAKGFKIALNTSVRGYQGQRTDAVDIVVRCTNGYDVGFVRKDDGTYEMIGDFWGVGATPDEFLAPIRQEYGKQMVYSTSQKLGFAVEAETVDAEGNLRLVLGRWV